MTLEDAAWSLHTGLERAFRRGPDMRSISFDLQMFVVETPTTRSLSNDATLMNSLVVFSHLRWNSVRNRPQHVMSRLARKWRVLFVEEPRFHAGDPRAELRSPHPGVTVLTPHTPLTAPGFHDDQIPLLSKLVAHALAREQIDDYAAWFYTPMALPLLTKLAPRIIVYDCMDELTAFPGAPRQLVQRENALLRVANVVFCGGPSLFEARRARRSDVHHLPNSVERDHFAHATNPALAHTDLKLLSRPRLGYCGVIDERLDLDLFRTMANARPEWEICLVGPVARIDVGLLPRAPNLHYFGRRRYDELPAFLAGWDVALLPFARTDATRFANPTTTLEYIAAERTIVSTPIPDVERCYGSVVRFGETPQAFIAACDEALVEGDADRAARIERMRRIVTATSWDDTVSEMRRMVDAASAAGLTDAARTMLEPARAVPPAHTTRSAAPCVILGAGPTGLSAAYHYGAGSVLLEREARVGGSCRSIEDTGFTFDHAGHIMFSNDSYVQELYRRLLGDNVHWQVRDAWIHTNGGYRVWGVPLAESDASWLGGRVPLPDEASAAGARSIGPSARFGYPLRGGFQALMNGFLPLLRGDLLLHASVARVAPREHAVTLDDGRRFRYDVLISTLPLPVLVAAIGDDAPADVRRAAGELRHVSVRCVNLGVARPHVTDKHWIHFPEGSLFHRVFMQGNASPHCNPPGGFGLTCEIAYSASKPLPVTGAALTERCFRECVDVGLLDASDGLLTTNQIDIPYAYVVYDQGRAERVARIRNWLAQFDILPAGRYGEWEHYNADHAFVAGKKAAEAALRRAEAAVAAKSA